MLNFIKKNRIGILTYAAVTYIVVGVEWLVVEAAYQAGLAKGTTEGVKLATSTIRTAKAIELADRIVSKNESKDTNDN